VAIVVTVLTFFCGSRTDWTTANGRHFCQDETTLNNRERDFTRTSRLTGNFR
jgi:hypothetical protein